MRNGLIVDFNGDKYWFKDDQLHREDGPAVEDADDTKYWFQNGRLHREDGPAVEYAGGVTRWYFKGIFVGFGDKPDPTLWERLTSVEANGGPLLNGCVVDSGGTKHWYKDDLLHREDGPAVELTSGRKDWHLNGEFLGLGATGFWELWDRLTAEQRGNPNLLRYFPR